ncbi:MAG TPA: TIGR03435 family protein [Bryobacteraceae bacterium]|nr:TIGR03435 family protein [Bryobacteraceae bacterium]
MASIQPSKPAEQSVITRLPGGRFTAEKSTLKILVKWAYELTDDELVGGPKWTDSDRYDIVATPENDAGNEQVGRDGQIRMMVRSMLADRFKLAMHREAREMPAYVLSVSKDGPKLTATTHPPGPQVRMRWNGQMRIMTFQAAPVSYVARSLSAQLHRKVVDETNVQGAFDCKLEWSPDMDRAAPQSGPSIFTAIQQLGLRLRMERVSVDVYVIDGVQRPSDN